MHISANVRQVRPAAKLMPPTVRRAVRAAVGTAEADAKTRSVVDGYAAVFGVVTELFRYGNYVFEEIIQRGAFGESLKRGDDVAAVVEHDWGRVVARRSGGTLELVEDDTGLMTSADLPETTEARDLVANIEHKNIKGMSFRFMPHEVTTERFERVEKDGQKVVVLRDTVKRCDISDVSYCVWPAYPTTNCEVGESYDDAEDGTQVDGARSAQRSRHDVPEWVLRRIAQDKQGSTGALRSRLAKLERRIRLDELEQFVASSTSV